MSESAPAHGSSLIERALWGALVLVLVAVVAAGLHRLVLRPQPEPLPVIAAVPDFSLVDSAGAPVSAEDFAGKIWIADFVFSRCGGICPLLSSNFAKLQGRLAAGVVLVSISDDPTYDRPEVLRAYGQRFGADPEHWRLLTGEREEIHRLVRDGFRLSVAEDATKNPEDLVTHSDRFVVIDRSRRVRAMHHGTDDGVVEAVLADVSRLIAEDG